MNNNIIYKNEKNHIIFICIYFLTCLIIGYIFITIYKIDRVQIKEVILDSDVICDATKFYYGMDPIIKEDDLIKITGWVVDKENSLEYIDRKVLLIDDKETILELKTLAYDRGLTTFFNTGYNYDLGGLMAQCETKKLEIGNEYRIMFLVTEQDGNKYLFNLNNTISLE